MFCVKVVQKYLTKFTGKHLYGKAPIFFQNEFARLLHECFPVNFSKLFRTAFVEPLWKTTTDLGKYLESLSTNYDLVRYMKTLTIIMDFVESMLLYSYEAIRKSYLEHGIIQKSFIPEKCIRKWVEFSK